MLLLACLCYSIVMLSGCVTLSAYGNNEPAMGRPPATGSVVELDPTPPLTTAPALSPVPQVTTVLQPAMASPLSAIQIPPRDERALAERLQRAGAIAPQVVNATPPSYKVGDQIRFWIENSDTQAHRQITATLKYVTPHVYIWVEQGVNLNQAALEQSADLFETQTYPTDRAFFGSEWTPGVDNDLHLSLLHARGLGSHIAGYYSSADEYSHLINPYSNEKEMFYISVDPGGAQPGTSFYDGVLAHEFQHMIHWARHPNEDSWVNEGMSVLATHLNGFETGGVENAYSEKPDTQLTTWADPNAGNAEHYGASYLFMDYFLGRFGSALTQAVVSDPRPGVAAFNDTLARAGRPERFDDIFAGWLVANYLDQPEADPKGRFGYPDITPPPPAISESYDAYPAEASGQVNQYGAHYINLKPTGDLTIQFTGQPTTTVVPAQTDQKYVWWSNRSDNSDTTLTRSVDLSRVTSATLTFSAWYNLEDGWDYTYVEVSTDGGAHWQILPGAHTTTDDKSGNALGPGWTGNSGGSPSPTWTEERVDLSPYAGREIQLRFETVTDDSYDGPGFLIEHVAIAQIGYRDDGAGAAGGWQAAGWVLTDNTLPEQWLVQVVASDSLGSQVQRMTVGPDGRGQLTLSGAAKYDDVKLIISALAPATTDPAIYHCTISAP